MMKRFLAIVLACLFAMGARAEYDPNDWFNEISVTREDLLAAVHSDYPGWMLVDDSWYGAGSWEGKMAQNVQFTLMRLENGEICLMTLDVMMDPLKPGAPVPWAVTVSAPIPVTEEAADRIAAMAPQDVFDGWNIEMKPEALPGCAEFLLNEGESWTQLLPYPDFLVGVVCSAEGREALRIAHWDGTAYTRVTATGWAQRYLSVNEVHSWNESLEFYADGLELYASCGEDGVWRIGSVMADEGAYYGPTDSGLVLPGYLFFEARNNDGYYYGPLTFPMELDGHDLVSLPRTNEEAIAQLDATGWACVRRDDAPLCDAPEGNLLATCYTRLPGRVIREEGDWVQLQIGSETEGMTGWFRRDDLAFGAEVNEIICTFPSLGDSLFDLDDVELLLPGLTARLGWQEEDTLPAWMLVIWLVGRTADGDWLVLVEEDYICTAPAEVITETTPIIHYWEY